MRSGFICMAALHSRADEFRKRFRRSGSLGIPFVPEEEIPKIKEYWSQTERVGKPLLTLIVTCPKKSETLGQILSLIQDPVRIQHIESRESLYGNSDQLEILLQLELGNSLKPAGVVNRLKEDGLEVAEIACMVPPISRSMDDMIFIDPGTQDVVSGSPWFPRNVIDLDICAKRVLMYGTELDADHPGFKDADYRKRRMYFADIALSYKHSQQIPRIQYTEEETKTWNTIYKELRRLHRKHACREFLDNFILLEKYCGYSEHSIPQLDDVNRFLKAKTGFRVRPVAGYLSSRDFLAGLAFRVFHCTQYIRHPSDPFYTPEPDCVHELMGHMAMFADPDFAQFSQDIGLASLGASESDVGKLSTLYFFSIEFGLCKQTNEFKIYGAGLLSSIGELKHAVDDKPEVFPFDPERVVQQECLITTFQAAYFYTDNFEEAQQKLRTFISHMRRPFVLRYNAYTESVEVLNNKRSLTLAVNQLRSDMNLLAGALHNVL